MEAASSRAQPQVDTEFQISFSNQVTKAKVKSVKPRSDTSAARWQFFGPKKLTHLLEMLRSPGILRQTLNILFLSSKLLKLWVLTRFFFPQGNDDMPDPVTFFLFLVFMCLIWIKATKPSSAAAPF